MALGSGCSADGERDSNVLLPASAQQRGRTALCQPHLAVQAPGPPLSLSRVTRSRHGPGADATSSPTSRGCGDTGRSCPSTAGMGGAVGALGAPHPPSARSGGGGQARRHPTRLAVPHSSPSSLDRRPSPPAGTQVSFPKPADAFAFEEDSSNDGLSPEQARSEDSPGSTESVAGSKAPEPAPPTPAGQAQVRPRTPGGPGPATAHGLRRPLLAGEGTAAGRAGPGRTAGTGRRGGGGTGETGLRLGSAGGLA